MQRVTIRGTAPVTGQRARESTTTTAATSPAVTPEEKDSGHIAVESNESVLFFDSMRCPPYLATSYARELTFPVSQTSFPSS